MARLRPRVEVLDVQLDPRKVVRHAIVESIERVPLHRVIDVAPPDVPFGRGLAHDVLVARAATGVGSTVNDEGTFVGGEGLAASQRMLVERGDGSVPMHGVPRTNAVFRQIWHTRLLDSPS